LYYHMIMATLQEHMRGKTRTYKIELARALGVSERTFNAYVAGSRYPSRKRMAMLVAATNGEVTVESFFQADEVAA
jgi:DNA-binding transcriptional regulator YdaS (Cro superfamily)